MRYLPTDLRHHGGPLEYGLRYRDDASVPRKNQGRGFRKEHQVVGAGLDGVEHRSTRGPYVGEVAADCIRPVRKPACPIDRLTHFSGETHAGPVGDLIGGVESICGTVCVRDGRRAPHQHPTSIDTDLKVCEDRFTRRVRDGHGDQRVGRLPDRGIGWRENTGEARTEALRVGRPSSERESGHENQKTGAMSARNGDHGVPPFDYLG